MINNWLTNVYKAFIYASVILLIIALNTSGNTTIGATIAGYSTMIFSLLIIMTMILNGVNDTMKDASTYQVFMNLLVTIGPFLVILGILGFLIYLLITYKTIISEGHVSSYYGSFSFLSSILVIMQIYLLYNGLQNMQKHRMSKITLSVISLTAVLNMMCAMILYVILKYYTTDG